jgi:hypothetical protein|tara:strand:- start:2041 stop:2781 length:741 start_codon:yes stop_codon:yes gene_type:complete
MKKINLVLIFLLLLNSCKDDDLSICLDPTPISFLSNGAKWIYIDSFSISPSFEVYEDWLFHDTFSLGNQVNLMSSFVSGTSISAKDIDTLPPISKTYYEVLARSSFGYKPETSSQENYKYLSTKGEKVSGWIRWDEDSLKLYSLRKENNSYFEYLMTDYSCDIGNQWFSPVIFNTESCEQITIHDSQFTIVKTTIRRRFASGIHLMHHSHLWQDKYPHRNLKTFTGEKINKASFKLLLNGKTYELQ